MYWNLSYCSSSAHQKPTHLVVTHFDLNGPEAIKSKIPKSWNSIYVMRTKFVVDIYKALISQPFLGLLKEQLMLKDFVIIFQDFSKYSWKDPNAVTGISTFYAFMLHVFSIQEAKIFFPSVLQASKCVHRCWRTPFNFLVPGSLLSSDESESLASLWFRTEIVQFSSHRKLWKRKKPLF